MKKILLTYFLQSILVSIGISQSDIHSRIIKDFESKTFNFDSLEASYPSSNLDDRFRDVILIVRQYYPELAKNHISLKFKDRSSRTISARPRVNLFKGRSRRAYTIIIRSGSENYILDKNLNAQIGLVAHEFSHFADYSVKSNVSLLAFGIKYLFSKGYRARLERDTDIDVIERGLGWQLKNHLLYLKFSEVEQKMKELEY